MANFILRKAEPNDVSDILRMIKVSYAFYFRMMFMTNTECLRNS